MKGFPIPTYAYVCSACNHEFDAFHKMAERLHTCPKCKKRKLEKQITMPALHIEENLSHLNGGMGEWSPQLAKNIYDHSPEAHFLSGRDLVRKGAKRGLAPVEKSSWNEDE